MLFTCTYTNLKLMIPIFFGRIVGVVGNLIMMIMLARLGETVLSASSLIMGVFTICVILVFSFSFSLCSLIARNFSQQKYVETGSILKSSLILNTIIAIPFFFALYCIDNILIFLGQEKSVSLLVKEYFHGFLYGYLPMIWMSVFDQFLIGIQCARYIFYLSVFSAFLSSVLGYLFIFGKLSIPAMGVFGAGLAASISIYVCLLVILICFIKNKWHTTLSLLKITKDYLYFKTLWNMGWPVSLQFLGEFFAYVVLIMMMGWISLPALAAQQIIMQFSSIVTMFPNSLAQAASVSISESYLKQEMKKVQSHMASLFLILFIVMSFIITVFLIFPQILINLFLTKGKVHLFQLTYRLLVLSLIGLFFDGIRNVFSGIYRGFQDTKKSMYITIVSLWVLSLPLAYYFGFTLNFGAEGVRFGYLMGMIFASLLFFIVWMFEKEKFLVQNTND